jgi:hypothetical protein
MKTITALVLLMLSVGPACAADSAWTWSLVALTAANTADAITTEQAIHRGAHELNPVLGNFGARGISIKAAVVGGQALAQWLVVRRHPRMSRPFAWGNTAQCALPAWAAWHNTR